MKFVKRISLFFIYPLTMFALGFASNMAIMEFFYPGDSMGGAYLAEREGESVLEAEPLSLKAEGESFWPDAGKEPVEVAMSEEPLVSANTRYILQHYDAFSGESREEEAVMPDKFIGLSRERLAEEIEEYNKNPSLTDFEQGFTYMELVSFSSERVVVRKSYESEEEKGFFLLNEDHYVVVYDHSLSHVYMDTEILVESLPESLQEEILKMKYVEDEKELYQFLETYTS